MNIKSSKTTKKIAANTIYQIVGKVFSMSITILATIIITRFYGREGYGEFSLMQTWPALFFVIVDFGINAIAARELSKDWKKANKIFGNIFMIRILFSLVLMVLIGVGLSFFPYDKGLLFGIRLSLLLILTQALFATTNIIFQVKLRYDYSTIGYGVGYVIILILVLLLSLTDANVIWVNFSYVIGGLLTVFINLLYVKKLGIELSFKLEPEIWKYYIVQSLPLGLMFVFSQINFKADNILLSASKLPDEYGLNNKESVAVYNLGYKVFEVALVVPTFLMNSVYPVLVRHMQENREKLKSTFAKTIMTLFGSGLLFGLIGIIFAPLAIKILGGDQFNYSISVLRILMGGLFLYYVSQPLAWLLVTMEEQKLLPLIYLVSALFNIIANYFYIPKYSIYASAVITHISELIILILLILTVLRIWKRKYAK
jgi:O-antigen/teichoic acid export membrane protein